MTEDKSNDKTQDETPEAEASEQAPEAAAEEQAPAAEEAPAEEEEAPAAEEPADDQPADPPAEPDAPAEDQPADPPAEPDAPAEDSAGTDEELTPKQRRKLERSRAGGPAGPQRSTEERVTERGQRRRAAAAERGRHRKRLRERRGGDGGTGTPPADRVPGKRKVRQGTVVSSAASKTITVRIERARRDPAYEKVVRRSSTLHAHDERDEANDGDVVRIVETRPLSRTKRWMLLEIVERAR